MRVVTPAGARKKVEEVVPVEDVSGDFSDPNVTFVTVPGTAEAEAALVVKSLSGTTLVINDIVGNIQDAKGLMRFVLSLMKFAGDKPHVPRPVKWKLIKDRAALAAQFTRWAAIPDLNRILVSHGSAINRDTGGVLRRLAEELL
jgi:hypothetical protein